MIKKISGILLFRTPSPAEKERDVLIERTISSQDGSSPAALLYRGPMSPLLKARTKVDHEFGVSDDTMQMLTDHASSAGASDRKRGNSTRKSSLKLKG